jgi:EmrB/QacA subfamily drug resistance transporter
VAQFMIVLDSTIVAVALPAMRDGLKISAGQQQWVVDSYLVALGGLLLLAARAGDLVGHRRVFRAGLAVFTLASLAGGLATSGPLLLAARAVQGIGAAALAPSSLSLITTTHTEAGRRTKALALWSLMGGAAGAAGVVLGGVLTAEVSWRWVLFVNVPVGVVLLAAAGLVLPRAPRRTGGGLDLPGALLVTAAAVGLTFGLSRAPSDGWTAAQVLGPLVAAPVLLALFAVAETRSATPLVPPSLLRSRSLGAGNGVMLCLGATMTAALVLITLYLQQCLGGAIGLAVLTSIADFAARSSGAADPVAAAVHGYHIAFLCNAGIMVLAVLAALALPRAPRHG